MKDKVIVHKASGEVAIGVEVIDSTSGEVLSWRIWCGGPRWFAVSVEDFKEKFEMVCDSLKRKEDLMAKKCKKSKGKGKTK